MIIESYPSHPPRKTKTKYAEMEISLRPEITSAAVSLCEEDGKLKDSQLPYGQVKANARDPFAHLISQSLCVCG